MYGLRASRVSLELAERSSTCQVRIKITTPVLKLHERPGGS
jgi:hypothetical protein